MYYLDKPLEITPLRSKTSWDTHTSSFLFALPFRLTDLSGWKEAPVCPCCFSQQWQGRDGFQREISGRGCLTSLSLYLYTHIHINTDTDFTVSKSEWNINIIQRVCDPACALWLFSIICQRNARPTMSWCSEYTQIRLVHLSFRVVKVICLHNKGYTYRKKDFQHWKENNTKIDHITKNIVL